MVIRGRENFEFMSITPFLFMYYNLSHEVIKGINLLYFYTIPGVKSWYSVWMEYDTRKRNLRGTLKHEVVIPVSFFKFSLLKRLYKHGIDVFVLSILVAIFVTLLLLF